MFSLQPCDDELVFAIPTTPQENQIPHHLIWNHSLSEGNLLSFSATSSNDKQLSQTTNFRSTRQRHGFNDRKVMHREIERKRRHQMSNLYVSLRTLLPPEQSKGRSSVCDQMEEAANYIKQMHKKIEELRIRRDNMKNLKNSSSLGTNFESADGSNCVSIHQVLDGFEILIRSKSPSFELSRVLAQLVERELDVVRCVSTRTKAGFLHKVEVEANDMTAVDVSKLHDRLAGAIK